MHLLHSISQAQAAETHSCASNQQQQHHHQHAAKPCVCVGGCWLSAAAASTMHATGRQCVLVRITHTPTALRTPLVTQARGVWHTPHTPCNLQSVCACVGVQTQQALVPLCTTSSRSRLQMFSQRFMKAVPCKAHTRTHSVHEQGPSSRPPTPLPAHQPLLTTEGVRQGALLWGPAPPA